MSKGQWENAGGRRGPESGFIAPEDVAIVELEDKAHPKHGFYLARLSPTDPEIVAFAADMRVVGWATGSVAFVYRDGDKLAAATARRRITAACIENARRKADKDNRPPIEVPCLITKDPATAEAIENSGRVDVPPMQVARDFVALKDGLGDEMQAAARLRLPLHTARLLERCLSLPLDIQGKVNRHEVPVDVAARMAGAGGAKAAEAVKAATDPATGKVDAKRAKKEAVRVKPTKAKTRPAAILKSWEIAVRASVTDVDNEDNAILRAYADGLAAAQGKPPPKWAERFHASAVDERRAGKGGKS